MRFDGGRLGNEMFLYASLLGIADRNKMVAVFRGEQLRMWFDITAEKSAESEENSTPAEVRERSAYVVESRFGQIASTYTGDVIIKGYLQCWRYFDEVEGRVRQEFQFNRELRNFAAKFLRTNTRLDGDVVYIGVHIRRGDMLSDYNVDRGYTVADEDYLQRAVNYMIVRLRWQRQYDDVDNNQPLDIVFVVCSDDIEWSEEHFTAAVSRSSEINNQRFSVTPGSGPSVTLNSTQSSNYHQPPVLTFTRKPNDSALSFDRPLNNNISRVRTQIIYSPGLSDGQDLALLVQCNHTIMTVGTFGWWAGYLAGGITVYYKDFPAKNSELYFQFREKEFSPPDWIGL